MSCISTTELRQGDILLYRPTDAFQNAVSWMIRWIDDSEVSHAGLYLGNEEVGEALIVGNSGVNVNPLVESVSGCEWVAVRRLPALNMAFDPVVSVGRRYLDQGNKYAFNQIFVLAIVCLIRKVDSGNPLVRRIAKRAMQEASEFLRRSQAEGKEPMICSEFVFRCYDEADDADDDPYSLEILSQTLGATVRRFSVRRRLRRSRRSDEPLPPNVHPQSLLAKLNSEPNRMTAQVGRLEAYRAVDDPQSLEELIEEFKGEGSQFYGALETSMEGGSDEELAESALKFAAELEDSLFAGHGGQSAKYESLPVKAEAAIDTLTAVVADFVTPGDLFRSPSLDTIGRLAL